MVDYTVVNGTSAAITDINAGGDDVPAYSQATGVALDATELAAVIALGGVAVLKDAQSYTVRRWVSRVMRYRKALAL